MLNKGQTEFCGRWNETTRLVGFITNQIHGMLAYIEIMMAMSTVNPTRN